MSAPVRFVTVEKFGDFSGYTPDAVRSKIKRGDWLEGAVWVKAPGLRTSELIALRWRDIDWRHELVLVRQARVSGEIKATKTEAGRREVKLLPPAAEALRTQKAHTLLLGEFVFHDPRTGEPWSGDKQIREWHWRALLKRADVRYRYPYQTRHTYASTLLSAGENPVWVASQMGHKDWVMIVRTYGRWIPSVDPTAGQRAAALAGSITKREAI